MLIILDRDGVINYDSEYYIKSPAEWRAIPGSLAAIAKLNKAGYKVVVATNQSGVGRGYYSLQTLEQIHQKMLAELKKVGGHLDGIYFCPHVPEDHCECRKPQPGLFKQIQQDYPALFAEALAVGDSWRDVLAAQAAGCQAVLVKTGNGAQAVLQAKGREDIRVYATLADFVVEVLSK